MRGNAEEAANKHKDWVVRRNGRKAFLVSDVQIKAELIDFVFRTVGLHESRLVKPDLPELMQKVISQEAFYYQQTH